MALSTMDRLKKILISSMDMVNRHNLKALGTAACGLTTVKVERDVLFILMVTSMMDNGKRAKPLVMESTNAVIQSQDTKASGPTMTGKILEFILVPMDKFTLDR